MQVYLRAGDAKAFQARQQPLLQKRAQRTDAQRAGTAVAAHVIDGALELLERLAHARQQCRAFVGEVHLASVAAEQGAREVLLQRADLQAGGTGADPEGIGRAGETQMVRDRNKYAQAAQGQPAYRRRR